MNILLIAPYYAPSSEVPSVRMVSLSNYLVQKGHKVTVLCYSRSMLLTMYDEKELSSQIPAGVNVIGFDVPKYKVPLLSDLWQGKYFKKNLSSLVNLVQYDVVLTTCGPYFTLKAMPMIWEKYHIPYVLDFRDLGALNYRPQLRTENDSSSTWKKIIKKWFGYQTRKREFNAVKEAKNVICISEIDKQEMKKAHHIPEEKLWIATNGYDEEKLSKVVPCPKKQGMVGAVFGKFMYYSKKRAVEIICGVKQLQEEGYDIKLIHIGRKYEWFDGVFAEYNIPVNCYENVGLREYADGMSILGSADFFFVEDTSPDDVGTKIYDYIYWNKPVIAATPKEIPLAKLVAGFEHGYVCNSKEEIYTALKEIVTKKYHQLDSSLCIENYSRKHQNNIIEQAIRQSLDRR